MTEPYIIWALLVGIAVGGALVWFVLGRLPRRSDDVSPEERVVEASWISDALAGRGRRAPSDLIEEVLELHGHYLAGPAPDLRPDERDALKSYTARRHEPKAQPTEPDSQTDRPPRQDRRTPRQARRKS